MKIGGRDWGSSKQEMRQWEWSWGLEMGAAGECKTDQEMHMARTFQMKWLL